MSRIHELFVTGTDTDAGKTLVAQAILHKCAKQGLSTAAYKPVSAGCQLTPQGLRNQDALILQSNSSIALTYDEVNPIAFADPVAPHLAAQKLAQPIDLQLIDSGLQRLRSKKPDLLLIEGAGGWRLPLGPDQYLSDFVKQHRLQVLMVVGLKLGCLNHALLTAQAIAQDGLQLVGWIGSQVDPNMLYLEENIQSLHSLIDAPNLGIVPHLEDYDRAVEYIRLPGE